MVEVSDGHIHTNRSIDGGLKSSVEIFDDILNMDDGIYILNTVAFADHDSFGGSIDFYDHYDIPLDQPYALVKGKMVPSATEITCRVAVRDSNGEVVDFVKVHLLVYGASMAPGSPLRQLLEWKWQNDIQSDIGRVAYAMNSLTYPKKHKSATPYDFIGFVQSNPSVSKMSFKSQLGEFLSWVYGVKIDSREVGDILHKMPRVERLDLDAADVIKIAKASGGKVVFAHPSSNLPKTAYPYGVFNALMDAGLDGFEVNHNWMGDDFYPEIVSEMIEDNTDPYRNPMIITGGSDYHRPNKSARASGKGGDSARIGSYYFQGNRYPIESKNLISLEDAMYELAKTRKSDTFRAGMTSPEIVKLMNGYRMKHMELSKRYIYIAPRSITSATEVDYTI